MPRLHSVLYLASWSRCKNIFLLIDIRVCLLRLLAIGAAISLKTECTLSAHESKLRNVHVFSRLACKVPVMSQPQTRVQRDRAKNSSFFMPLKYHMCRSITARESQEVQGALLVSGATTVIAETRP